MDIKDLLEKTISMNASDLHLVVNMPPMLRIDGELQPIETKILSDEKCQISFFTQRAATIVLPNPVAITAKAVILILNAFSIFFKALS